MVLVPHRGEGSTRTPLRGRWRIRPENCAVILTAPLSWSRHTAEQRLAFTDFRALVAPLRLRVKADAEGFPIALGRYGHLEWYDAGQVAIHSQTMRMLAKLTRIPGIRRHQLGDHEFRLLLAVEDAHDRAALGAIARLLRVRTRRALSERQKLTLVQGRRLLRGAGSRPSWSFCRMRSRMASASIRRRAVRGPRAGNIGCGTESASCQVPA
jgi:hypothetical protein